MSIKPIRSADPIDLVAAVADVEDGGILSREHAKLSLLRVHRHIHADGKPCAAFFDRIDGTYKIMTVCAVTGNIYCIGKTDAEGMDAFCHKAGVFWVDPRACQVIPFDPDAA